MHGAKRIFGFDDQMAFAGLSGDFNPLHIDSIKARRSMAGGAVVHGIHLLLWALNCWCAQHEARAMLQGLDVLFLKPVPVGAEVSLTCTRENAERAALVLAVGSAPAVMIDFCWRPCADSGAAIQTKPEACQPKDLSATDLPGRCGELSLCLEPELAHGLFGYLLDKFSLTQIAVLLASTRLVGMECPGLYSLYSELHFEAVPDNKKQKLLFEVTRFDPRFRLATMKIDAPGLHGSIKAFLRPEPQGQPGCAVIREAVAANRFAGQRVLVVGGSRGLGEVVAKVLAMGGADVLLTYHAGEQDASLVVTDILGHGGKAACIGFDVTGKASESMAFLTAWQPTHLYYMATPYISCGQRSAFCNESFVRFCDYYVDGFARLFEGVKSGALRTVLYPSSVFLDELPLDMSEYVAAKSAGEVLCAMLQKANPDVRFLRPRLPRLATDQTLSLLPVNNMPALPLVLDLLSRDFSEIP